MAGTSHRSPAQSGMSRRSVLQLGGGVALLVALASCARGSGSAGSGDEVPMLRVGVPGYPGSWDQDYVGFDPTALMLFKNVYPYMIDYGVAEVDGARVMDTQNIVPTFAESFEPDEENRVWTLKLRRGVRFASGNELTAHDVKWSKDRAFAAQANVAGIYRTIGLTEPDQVRVVDDYTVEFHQAFPSALTREIQAISLYVFDSEEAKKHATDDDPWATRWFANNPPTGGYFNVTRAVQGQEIVLEPNPDYPGPDPAQVRLRLTVVPSSSNQRLQLQNGDIDVALGMSQRDVRDLKDVPGVKVISAPSNEQVAIQMSVTTPPFDNVNVRKALAYAVPYDLIINNVYGGEARPCRSVVPLDMPGYDERGYPYTYDLDAARAALDAAGVDSVQAELVYEADNETQQQIAVLVQSEAAKVGIDLQLTALDPATLGERRQKRNIPLQITSGQLWVNDVEYMLATSFVQSASLNYSSYSHPEIEEIYERSHTVVDEQERMEMWLRVQEILAEDVPWVVICQPNFNLPVSERVAGWVQPIDGLARLRYLRVSE
ncbi:MAG TPA: ABC transporter substrate-binding protein [Natronosporangium sp.]|nr:ABC transporter substrate-binding protein [Natronosporangium sp.]